MQHSGLCASIETGHHPAFATSAMHCCSCSYMQQSLWLAACSNSGAVGSVADAAGVHVVQALRAARRAGHMRGVDWGCR